jgi:Trypsin-like peptidase domain
MADGVNKEAARLLARADRLLAGRTVTETFDSVRAVIGPPKLPFDASDAQRALDKLRDGDEPAPIEWIALRVVIQLMRPAVFTVSGGTFEPLPAYGGQDQQLADAWQESTPTSSELSRCVGRIDDFNEDHVGTGFLVAPDLIATNRHVLDHLTLGTGRLFERAATILFGWERNTRNKETTIAITECVASHDALDVVVLRIAVEREHRLTLAEGGAHLDQIVVAIGYPGKTIPSPVYAQVFGDDFGVRRASPGMVRTCGADDIEHDCSTIGGSSGSPLIALPSGDVIGIHYGGQSSYANNAVPANHLISLLGGSQ